MNDRRQFLLNCAAAAACVCLPAGAAGWFARAERGNAAARLEYGTFAALVNTPFRARPAGGAQVALLLLRARVSPAHFSLVFGGPAEPILPAAIHSFEHDEMGRFEMYIGEIGLRAASGARYEAIFSAGLG